MYTVSLSLTIDYIRPMDMKLISATVCLLVSRPYVISGDHSLQIQTFNNYTQDKLVESYKYWSRNLCKHL